MLASCVLELLATSEDTSNATNLAIGQLVYPCARPVARGRSVGLEEPPSQIKGPLFCNERSTF